MTTHCIAKDPLVCLMMAHDTALTPPQGQKQVDVLWEMPLHVFFIP